MRPVFFIIIAVVIVYAVVMIIVTLRKGANSHFVCPKCGHDFQVKGAGYLLSPKTLSSHDVTCPKCGYRGFMEVQKGTK